MVGEKLVASLGDLQNAALVAAQQGVCEIRLSCGATYALRPIHSDKEIHVVTDPENKRIVRPRPTAGGKLFSGEELKEEIRRRLKARSPGGGGAAR